jgi:hypothetical protein
MISAVTVCTLIMLSSAKKQFKYDGSDLITQNGYNGASIFEIQSSQMAYCTFHKSPAMLHCTNIPSSKLSVDFSIALDANPTSDNSD